MKPGREKEKVVNVYEAKQRGKACKEGFVVFLFFLLFEARRPVKDISAVLHQSKRAPELLLFF